MKKPTYGRVGWLNFEGVVAYKFRARSQMARVAGSYLFTRPMRRKGSLPPRHHLLSAFSEQPSTM